VPGSGFDVKHVGMPGRTRRALRAFCGRERGNPMAHATKMRFCAGPDSPHAFDNVGLQPRNGSLDARCPLCRGHGQWNVEIDLVSFRCKRAICGRCLGAGWVETGSDPIALADIELSPDGDPMWVTRYVPRQDVAPEDKPKGPLPPPG